MAADFSGTPRSGYAPLEVTFTDASTGTIVARSWDLGDGTKIQGNETSFSYTYTTAGIYDIQLTVEDNLGATDAVTKENYIVVDQEIDIPELIIAQSNSKGEGRYWKFYLDAACHLIFENELVTYRSKNKIVDIGVWTFVQFNPGSNTAYVGDAKTSIRRIDMIRTSTSSPEVPTKKRLFAAKNSSMYIDELRIWYGEQNLISYFKSLWGRADFLS